MFNYFNKPTEYPKVETPKWYPAEQEKTYYSIGPTNQGRVMLMMYYGNASLNRAGLDSLIAVLESSKAWLDESLDPFGEQPEDGLTDSEDGGIMDGVPL